MTGREIPQALDLEKAVIGAILLEQDSLNEVVDILKPEVFYDSDLEIVYRCIRSIFDRGGKIDILTVTEELKQVGKLDQVGGPYFVSKLTNNIASSANIEAHSRIILQKHIKRELLKLSGKMSKNAYDDTVDIFDNLSEVDTELSKITGVISAKREKPISLIVEQIEKIDLEIEKGNKPTNSVPTGLQTLTEELGGFYNGDLIVLAARPGMGKTSLAGTFAVKNASLGMPVGFFSLEMSEIQITQRLISYKSGISVEDITTGKIPNNLLSKYKKAKQDIAKLPIIIDDTPALHYREFRAKALRMKRKYGVKLIIADYIQLFTGTGSTREQIITSVSNNAKAIAKEADIPIVMLSQLSRAVEKRQAANPRPMLSDLRDSGAIEQDADMVMFIYRPEYYDIKQSPEGESYEGIAEINIAKRRNGRPNRCILRFDGETTSFTDLKEEKQEQQKQMPF